MDLFTMVDHKNKKRIVEFTGISNHGTGTFE